MENKNNHKGEEHVFSRLRWTNYYKSSSGVVSVVEASNLWGMFASVRVERSGCEARFIIIPAGSRGSLWLFLRFG